MGEETQLPLEVDGICHGCKSFLVCELHESELFWATPEVGGGEKEERWWAWGKGGVRSCLETMQAEEGCVEGLWNDGWSLMSHCQASHTAPQP